MDITLFHLYQFNPWAKKQCFVTDTPDNYLCLANELCSPFSVSSFAALFKTLTLSLQSQNGEHQFL